MDSLIKDHPFNKAEDLGNGLKIITEIHTDYDGGVTEYDAHPEDFANMDWYGVVVTITRNGQEIGSGSLWGIATDDYTDDYLNEIAKENRDEALDEARDWLKAEIEAIQSGQREAELFAAVTALNTPSNQPQLL